MTDERVGRLNHLGFVWDWQEKKGQETWMKWYRELETYAREHGNPHVPRTHANTKLASWVWIQRIRRDKPYGKTPPLTNEQAALLDKLGFRWDAREEKWAERIEQLKYFKAQYGHCEVGSVASDDDDLLRWVGLQRSMMARGKMDAERKAQLEELGFSWTGKIDRRWEETYDRLKAYHAERGNSDVPARWKPDPEFARWVSQQRLRRKKGLMPDDQIQLLDALSFTWQHRERGSWEDRLAEVAAFKTKNGHCEIPLKNSENPKLGAFVNTMRTQRNNGSLSADRIAKLDALGFVWASSRKTLMDGDGVSAEWQARFTELLQYKQEHGNCDVPAEWPVNPQLGHWVNHQRGARKNGTIRPERQRRLDEIGFDWRSESRTEEWTTRFDQLKAYKERFRNCCVPSKWRENPQLGRWVSKQRQLRKNGQLSPEKEQMLHEIGFASMSTRKAIPPAFRKPLQEPVTGNWKKSFDELVIYQRKHGNCDVPVKWKENPQLGGWAAAQRALKKSGKLHHERERLLNEIGFDWRTGHTKEEWETRFEQLKRYKERFGDCCVPTQWKENPQLGAWVARHRHLQKTGKLSGDKERLLTELGFASAQRSTVTRGVKTATRGVNRAWSARFDQLVQYKAQYGDCSVPTRWPSNRGLGIWVSNQRQLKKQGKLEAGRERMLSEIGFIWANSSHDPTGLEGTR